MEGASGLMASALPTARAAFGLPIARAICEYVLVCPRGMREHARSTLCWKGVSAESAAFCFAARCISPPYPHVVEPVVLLHAVFRLFWRIVKRAVQVAKLELFSKHALGILFLPLHRNLEMLGAQR